MCEGERVRSPRTLKQEEESFMKRMVSIVAGAALLAAVPAFAGSAAENAKDSFKEAGEATGQGFKDGWEATKDGSKKAADATGNALEDGWDATKKGAEGAWDATKDSAEGSAAATKKAFSDQKY